MNRRVLPLLALLAAALAPAARADRLITKDGRILELKKARALPDGKYLLVFESGEITCPQELVASVEIEGDMSDYVPANEDEKKKLADGYVRYRGRWLSKAAYQSELNRQAELTKARTAELAAHSRFPDGWEKETKHFQLKSDTSPELLDSYAELLETYYDLMDQRVGIKPSPTLRRTKMRVNVYKSRAEFQEFTKAEPDVLGFFSFVDEELQFFHNYEDPAQSQWTALHEGTHLLTYLIEPQAWPQVWANEGVADYFGSAKVARDKKGKLQITPGQLQLDRVLTVQQAIEDKQFVPLDTLFLVDRDDFRGFEYSHAWSFVYFLNNSKYEPAFRKFFKDFYGVAKGVPFELQTGFPNQQGAAKVIPPEEVRRLLLDKLGVKDLGKLEQEWLAFVAAIPIDGPEARFRRGFEALYRDTDEPGYQRALEDLDAAIGGGVKDARAFWARGLIQLMTKGEAEPTIADFRRAVELEPLEAGYRANLAQMLSGMSLVMPGDARGVSEDEQEELDGSEEELVEAELHFGLACELAPENEALRESRDVFLQLLQEKSGSR